MHKFDLIYIFSIDLFYREYQAHHEVREDNMFGDQN